MCIFRLLRVSNLCEDQTKAVFALKLIVGGVSTKWLLTKVGSVCFVLKWIGVEISICPPGLRGVRSSMLHSWRSAGFDFANKVVFVAFIARWVGLGNATQRIGYLTQVVDQVLPAAESSQL